MCVFSKKEVCPNGKEPVSKTGRVKAFASSNLAASSMKVFQMRRRDIVGGIDTGALAAVEPHRLRHRRRRGASAAVTRAAVRGE